MLRKFISIKTVGRFVNYGAGGDVELKRYNLIFAKEDGRGQYQTLGFRKLVRIDRVVNQCCGI